MYLRHVTVRKDGKVHTYWRLVRSVRVGSRVRQEIVATLGELDAAGRAQARTLCGDLAGHAPQGDLFEPAVPPAPVAVNLRAVRVERGRRFGDVWLGWTLWRALGLEAWAAHRLPVGREEIPWAAVGAVLVLARLCEPASELHIAEDWVRRTAVGDLLGIPEEALNEDRLYRALDRLLPHKADLERHLKDRLGTLFAVTYDLLLYDVTSTYFEGLAAANPLAQYGYSRDHRPDCKQVCLALVVTREGLPLAYAVFPGNTHDGTTVARMVTTVEARYGAAARIWVMDRGMVSPALLAFLRGTGRQYIVGTPKGLLRSLAPALTADGWTAVRPGIEVKQCPSPEPDELFVLCRSQDRQRKEQAIHARFGARLATALERLAGRLARARRPVDRAAVERQLGRLLSRNSRAAGAFTVQLQDAPDQPARACLVWARRADWAAWAAASEGAYVLRTNLRDLSPDELWRLYSQLTEAEAAFRLHKSELLLRPIWHQKAERVQAHILVCFLAYVLYKTLEQWGQRAGLGKSPRTLLEEFARIQSTDVVLPTLTGRELRLRCVVQPDQAQAILLQRLGLDLPKRLRLPSPDRQV